ncbi:Hypothetical protein I5071_85330 [Sandaracinus amylolyticus]|nr:Hypothetical protein I5071_85330 [Sandaracinus amylolyticus]
MGLPGTAVLPTRWLGGRWLATGPRFAAVRTLACRTALRACARFARDFGDPDVLVRRVEMDCSARLLIDCVDGTHRGSITSIDVVAWLA